jgi:transcriptional regulator with XRE-family HTH domain
MELSQKHEKRIAKIGERIRQLRVDAGYTSYETFAFDNEIPRVQYGRIEKGVNFRIATLMRILDVHKISLEEFFKGLK